MSLHHHPDWNQRPCKSQWPTYDTLIDYDRGPMWRMARKEAMSMCGKCTLRADCFQDASEAGDTWHLPVAEGLVKRAIRRLEGDAA